VKLLPLRKRDQVGPERSCSGGALAKKKGEKRRTGPERKSSYRGGKLWWAREGKRGAAGPKPHRGCNKKRWEKENEPVKSAHDQRRKLTKGISVLKKKKKKREKIAGIDPSQGGARQQSRGSSLSAPSPELQKKKKTVRGRAFQNKKLLRVTPLRDRSVAKVRRGSCHTSPNILKKEKERKNREKKKKRLGEQLPGRPKNGTNRKKGGGPSRLLENGKKSQRSGEKNANREQNKGKEKKKKGGAANQKAFPANVTGSTRRTVKRRWPGGEGRPRERVARRAF